MKKKSWITLILLALLFIVALHSLKSSLRTIGAEELGEEAQTLENAGKRDDLEYIRSHHVAFLGNCRALGSKLAEAFR